MEMRGWLRIVEAIAAILMIFVAVLIVINDSRVKPDNGLCSNIEPLLNEIGKTQELRDAAFNQDIAKLSSFVEDRLNNPTIEQEVHVCSPEDNSGCLITESGIQGTVCAGERILSVNVGQTDEPVKVKIFLYQ